MVGRFYDRASIFVLQAIKTDGSGSNIYGL